MSAFGILKKTWLIFFVCGCLVDITRAQSPDSLRQSEVSSRIERMSNSISVKLDLNSRTQAFVVRNPINSPDLRPNVATQTDLSVNYRFLSLHVRYAADWLPGNGDDAEKGATRIGGIGTSFVMPHWFHDVSYQRTRGYYLANTSEFITGWKPGDPYVQFPDLVVTNFEGTSGYSFNPGFSLRALTTQTERQVKSAGSFIPRAVYRYYIADDRSSLQNPGSQTQRSDNFELLIGAGYHYTYVWRESFYASVGAQAGVGYYFSKLTIRDQAGSATSQHENPIGRFDLRLGMGYNGKKFFGGVVAQGDWASFKQADGVSTTREYRTVYHFFVGYRFKSPSPIRKFFDGLEEKGRRVL
ncbi:MAG: DUF4421 family protein [Cyclobacteriaceae bacterium]|jgi:hypothetical protein